MIENPGRKSAGIGKREKEQIRCPQILEERVRASEKRKQNNSDARRSWKKECGHRKREKRTIPMPENPRRKSAGIGKEKTEQFVTDVVHDRVPIGDVKMLTEDDYFVRGCTALLDAVGGAIHHIGNVHKYAREEDRPAKTLFVITTDGLENASRHYSFHDVKKMIERQREKYHWEFLFLGANIDAIEVAGLMGINRDRAANYLCDDEGTELNYKVLEAAVTRVRESEVSDIAMAFAGGAWKEEIDRDYEKRGKKNGRRAK